MTWLIENRGPSEAPGARLEALWRRPGIVRIPGAHNGLMALLAKRAGFEALYLSGAAVSASMGLPDLGVITLADQCFFTRMIHRATGLPVVVDGDTGFGDGLAVMRAVRELEEAGAAAIQIEDQIAAKKCGHLDDKSLVTPGEMAARVSAAARARRHLRIVARTDAVATEGLDGAIRRAKLYLEAGADAIFPEALTSADMFKAFASVVDAPLLANMTEFGRTPYLTAAQFEACGVKMVIWPLSSLRVAAKAAEDLYGTLAADGAATALIDRMQTRAELYETIGYQDYEALERDIAAPDDAGGRSEGDSGA